METASPYRKHNSGYDYYAPGIYLITLVLRDREALLGRLNMDAHHPAVNLTAVGAAVADCWQQIPAHHAVKGRNVDVLASCVMPDHFHGVIEVKAPLDVSVGEVIRSYKTAVPVLGAPAIPTLYRQIWQYKATCSTSRPSSGKPSMPARKGAPTVHFSTTTTTIPSVWQSGMPTAP